MLDDFLFLLSIIIAVIATVLWIVNTIIYFSYKIGITEKHLILTQGAVTRKRKEYFLNKILAVEVIQNTVNKVFNNGKVIIYLQGDVKEIFENVKNPNNLKDRLNGQIDLLSQKNPS